MCGHIYGYTDIWSLHIHTQTTTHSFTLITVNDLDDSSGSFTVLDWYEWERSCETDMSISIAAPLDFCGHL
jgi:hypothetical protein